AMQVFGGVCAALFHRERTGVGQRVETSLLQAIMAMQSHYYVEPLDNPEEGEVGIYPYRLFETSDDVIFIGAGTDKFWRLLCDAIGLRELGADPRYANNGQRVNAAEELAKTLAPHFKTRTTAEW